MLRFLSYTFCAFLFKTLKFYCEIILVQPLKVTSCDYVCDSCILPVSSI